METASLRSTSKVALFALALILVAAAAPVSPVFINGKPLGNAQTINGVPAISLEDFANAVGGTLRVQGNFLTISPRDPASGLPTGKRMHKPFVITKELDKATPLLYLQGKPYVPVANIAKLFGFAAPANSRAGQVIQLNFAPNPTAALAANP